MSFSRILVFGNHSCSNRGDAAIARGLLEYLRETWPSARIDFYTRFPEAAHFILGVSPVRDPLDAYYAARRGLHPIQLLLRHIEKRYFAPVAALGSAVGWGKLVTASAHRAEFARDVARCDLYVQVGGSFFVDVYGGRQFEGLQIALAAGVPTLLAGHSLGPFSTRQTRFLAQRILPKVDRIMVREQRSLDVLRRSGVPTANVVLGEDTAWLMPESSSESVKARYYSLNRNTVALTVRELAPFDRRLGVSQDEYENAIARLCGRLISAGYTVCAISTCTGLDSYTHDDRMVAQRIRRRLKSPEAFAVVMDELTDLEIGDLLRRCRLLIGTRLHSAIISMRFGTPAIALAYEHKAVGVLEAFGAGDRAIEMKAFCRGDMDERILGIVQDALELRAGVLAGARERAEVCRDALKITCQALT